MPEKQRMHGGVVVGDPGKRTMNQALREDAAKKPKEDETVWDERKIVGVLGNGWQLELISTEKDANRMSARHGGCWATNIWGAHCRGDMEAIRMCEPGGLVVGGITLGDKERYDKPPAPTPGYYGPAYGGCDGLGLWADRQGSRPYLILGDRTYYVLECLTKTKDRYLSYGQASPDVVRLVRAWFDSLQGGK